MSASGARALRDLLRGMADPVPDLRVRRLCLDSRELEPGDAFIALRGAHHDARRYLPQARDAGAAVAIVEDEAFEATGLSPATQASATQASATPARATQALPTIAVPALRQRVGEIAARYFGQPSRRLHVAAVTGTNGKTTVSHLFAQLVRALGYECGVVGTLGASLDGAALDSVHTTPDALRLQETLAAWAHRAVPFASLEASSHALHQGRVHGVDVDTAIFTNLTRDHLDYHGDMPSYAVAKARLFEFASLRSVVLNADDEFSSFLRQRLDGAVSVLRYGLLAADAEVRARRLKTCAQGLRLAIESPWGAASVRCPLLGRFNAANLLAALSAALQAGLPFAALIAALERVEAAPGRMQALRRRGAPLVVIDYAHTPDALTQVLKALREQCRSRLIAVFGCGGDRDRGKRALMAGAVSALADYAVLTSDNPRGEDPAAIIADVEAAMTIDHRSVVDRGAAIAAAIGLAAAGDCVLIAGKGHENYQIIGTRRLAFNDCQVARQVLDGVAA